MEERMEFSVASAPFDLKIPMFQVSFKEFLATTARLIETNLI